MLVTTTIVMLLFKHKIIDKNKWEKKQGREERSLYVSTSRLDTYISYDKSKEEEEEGDLYMYTYIWIYYIVVL